LNSIFVQSCCHPLGEENVKVNWVGFLSPPAGGLPDEGETEILEGPPVVQAPDAGPGVDPLLGTTYQ